MSQVVPAVPGTGAGLAALGARAARRRAQLDALSAGTSDRRRVGRPARRRHPRIVARRGLLDRHHAGHTADRRRHPPIATAASPRRRRCCTIATSSRSRSSATCRPTPLQALLRVLTLDAGERRRRGGPAQHLGAEGQPPIAIEQIDYEKVLAREAGRRRRAGQARRPLALDRACRSSAASKAVFDERAQERLLAIAGSAPDIGDLATAVMAPKCDDRRLADDHVAGGHGPRRLPPPVQHRVGDVARSPAGGDGQPRDRRHAARSARRHAGARRPTTTAAAASRWSAAWRPRSTM